MSLRGSYSSSLRPENASTASSSKGKVEAVKLPDPKPITPVPSPPTTLSSEVELSLSSLTSPTWRPHLMKPASTSSFSRLVSFVSNERAKKKIYPPEDEVFSAFNLTPFSTIKVVIVGQDPYHGPNQGHGLSFSVKPGVAIPPSLRNIYKEAMSDGSLSRKPNHGYLKSWAEQGVFMLNSVLTVRGGEANSHQKRGWEEFTDSVIRAVSRERSGVVFMLWGKPAQKKCASVSRSKHLVITSSHPSPLGATKTAEPFIGSGCFRRANEYLRENGGEGINWNSILDE